MKISLFWPGKLRSRKISSARWLSLMQDGKVLTIGDIILSKQLEISWVGQLRHEIVSYLSPFSPISKDPTFGLAILIVAISISLATAFIPKLFLRVFAPNFMHLLFLILINVVTKFSAPTNFFSRQVILGESQSELCAKNVTNST